MSDFPGEIPGARVPMLFRQLGLNLALGAALGLAFTAFVITTASGLRELIETTSSPMLAIAMLAFMNVLTFGSLAMGIGIMSLPLERRFGPAGPDRLPAVDDAEDRPG